MDMKTLRRSIVIGSALGALALGAGPALGQARAPAPAGPPAWSGQAEETFMLGRGMGPRLMTEQEWREHQEKMRTMTAAEREQYRQEVHARMLERARDQGLAMPGQRGPGTGPRSGMAPGSGPKGGTGRGSGPAPKR